jgi:hypothetical protein
MNLKGLHHNMQTFFVYVHENECFALAVEVWMGCNSLLHSPRKTLN